MPLPAAIEATKATTTPVVKSLPKKVDPVACNCYAYVKAHIPSFPHTYDLIANSINPVVGGVVYVNYSGIMHYMIVKAVGTKGVYVDESNFHKCKYSSRFLTWSYLSAHNAKYWIS